MKIHKTDGDKDDGSDEEDDGTQKDKNILNELEEKEDNTEKINNDKCEEVGNEVIYKGKKRTSSYQADGMRYDDVKESTVFKRPSEFPGHFLTAHGKKLYCDCCSSEIGSARGSVRRHIKCKSHLSNLAVKLLNPTLNNGSEHYDMISGSSNNHDERSVLDKGKDVLVSTMVGMSQANNVTNHDNATYEISIAKEDFKFNAAHFVAFKNFRGNIHIFKNNNYHSSSV